MARSWCVDPLRELFWTLATSLLISRHFGINVLSHSNGQVGTQYKYHQPLPLLAWIAGSHLYPFSHQESTTSASSTLKFVVILNMHAHLQVLNCSKISKSQIVQLAWLPLLLLPFKSQIVPPHRNDITCYLGHGPWVQRMVEGVW